MLEGDKNSFEETVKIINTFGNKSGLFLNAGKTSAIWLGNERNSPIKYMPNLHMDWNPPKFKILGIWFTNTLKECELLNFRETFFFFLLSHQLCRPQRHCSRAARPGIAHLRPHPWLIPHRGPAPRGPQEVTSDRW